MTTNLINQPIFLCGMMGSGKSTIGKVLAQKMGVSFHDLDDLIEEKLKMSIPEIFKYLGEVEFRKTERELLLNNSTQTEGILALGGGSLQNQELVNHVKERGVLVFLDCSRSVLFKRLKNSKNRPLLQSPSKDDSDEKINQLLDQRLPFYTQAHIIIQIDKQNKHEIANTIINRLANYE